jgi:hypothetical protein
VLALDPVNAHAMIHLARMDAVEGRDASLDSLARRFSAVHSGAERGLEMRALRAFATGDRAEASRVFATGLTQSDVMLNSVLEPALFYAQAWDALPTLSLADVRGRGGDWLQHWGRLMTELPVARGHWASPAPPTGMPVETGWLLETRALMASDPLFKLDRAMVARIRDTIGRLVPYPVQVYLGGVPDPAAATAFRQYLLGLLSARLGDTARGRAHLRDLAALRDTMAPRLVRGLAAEIARSAGDLTGALRQLELVGGVPSHSRRLARAGVRERFLRGEVLRLLGRYEEAIPWYASFWSAYDLFYIAPAHLRLGEIYERLGRTEEALFHYRRFIEMWKDCDAAFRPLLQQAQGAAERLEDLAAAALR